MSPGATAARASGGEPRGPAAVPAPPDTDMGHLIERIHELSAARGAVARTLPPVSLDDFTRRTGFAPRRRGKPEVVLGADVALELGHPATASLSLLLSTQRPALVQHRRLSLLGPDLSASPPPAGRLPFGQVVMLALGGPGPAPDPFELDSAQLLIHRLPGYMVRSVPGRLWVRISRAGRAAGLCFATVAQALIAAYTGDFVAVTAVEVLFITQSAADVEALAPIALEADVLSRRHKKLYLSPDGDLECTELGCDSCDEKPVCDDLRDIVRQRRARGAAGSRANHE